MIAANNCLDNEIPQPPFDAVSKVEIAICTWNRANLLEKTIQSVKKLIVPYQVSLRVIIVNNHSNDGTAELLEHFANDSSFTKRHQVLVLDEKRQGHTFARNRAIENLDSDLLIWTDDDVVLDAFLLQNYVEFADNHRNLCFFGGKISPDFETEPEPWITENWQELKGCFATRDLGENPVSFTNDRLPYGANFAIRSKVQQRFPFDVQLGRRAKEVHGEDELEMLRRLLDQGYGGSWVPGASVDHFIDASRMTELYVRDYFVGQGRAMAARGEAWSNSTRKLKWRSLLRFMNYRFKRQFASSDKWVPLMLESALAAGQALELDS